MSAIVIQRFTFCQSYCFVFVSECLDLFSSQETPCCVIYQIYLQGELYRNHKRVCITSKAWLFIYL
jgi:hypothetical protein